jgi:hypothetical protein
LANIRQDFEGIRKIVEEKKGKGYGNLELEKRTKYLEELEI